MLTDSASVTPDMSIIPKKYHIFISPSLRRVYLDAEADRGRAVIENLKAEIASLKRDNGRFVDRCQAAENTAAAALRRLNERMRLALEEKQNPKRLRAEYDALKSLFFLFCEVVLEITGSVAGPSGRQ
jgi:hypothetical protein